VEFYVDEAGLKVIGASKEDLKDGVKLSGSITFLTQARESEVVLSL
jgi:Predicted peroxiredoxins